MDSMQIFFAYLMRTRVLFLRTCFVLLGLYLLVFSVAAHACSTEQEGAHASIQRISTNYQSEPVSVDLDIAVCGANGVSPESLKIEPNIFTIQPGPADAENSNVWSYVLTSEKFEKGGFFPIHVYFANQPDLQDIRMENGGHASIHVNKLRSRHYIALLAVFLIVLAGFSGKLQRNFSRLGNWIQVHQKGVALSIVAVGFILISAGVTGSSIRFFLNSPGGQSFLETKGSAWSFKSAHPDRGDEWSIMTPGALAQIQHDPQFPIVNTHLGPEGQNMGVMGMTSVPIKQIAAVARPATWGYFFLPLRQAMSWHWQVPFFLALLSVWWFLNTLVPARAGRNLALSLAFCVAPYAAAWSNWPLYATAFPVLGVCLAIRLLKTQRLQQALLLGLALGWTGAAWVLVLYPPWLVIVGSLCLFLLIGWSIDNVDTIQWKSPQWLALLAALLVSVGVLWSWWIDTQDAIHLIQATVYPGGRQLETGGGAPIVWTLRGYLGLEVIPHTIGPAANKSEISSYFYAPFALAAAAMMACIKAKRIQWIAVGLAAFLFAYWWYSFIGFPVWLAQLTKWGVLTTNRMDLGLGLAIITLVALLSRSPSNESVMSALYQRFFAGTIAVISAWLAWWVIGAYSPNVMPLQNDVFRVAMVLMCGVWAWWLIRGNAYAITLASVILGLAVSWSFNPITKAPRSVELQSQTLQYVQNENGEKLATFVVDESTVPAMALFSAGVPVLDGVLYYPHTSMWEVLKLDSALWKEVNRYQHLIFVPGPADMLEPYKVSAPRMDVVVVQFNPTIFDYAALGAQRVVTYYSLAERLKSNPQLELLGQAKDYVWFRVAQPTR